MVIHDISLEREREESFPSFIRWRALLIRVRSMVLPGCTSAVAAFLTFLTTYGISHSVMADDVEVDRTSAFDAALAEEWQAKILPILSDHCFDCHGPETQEASVNFSTFTDLASIRSQSALWDQVGGLVKLGAMPPPDTDTLDEDTRERIASWVENTLHRVDCGVVQPPGHVTLRRLNNFEYDNTVRDLFGLDVLPSKKLGFVSDEVGNGFDNQGEVLSLPPLMMEKYLAAAEWIADQVIVLKRESLRRQRNDGTPISLTESFKTDFEFAEGEYQLSARLRFGEGQSGAIRVRLSINGEELETFDLPPGEDTKRWTRSMSSGVHSIQLDYLADPEPPSRGRNDRRLFVDWIGIEGPRDGLPPFPRPHRDFMIAEPNESLSVQDAAKQIFSTYLTRAYRRPIDEADLTPILAVVQKASEAGWSFPEAIRAGLEASLSSPAFLFRAESASGSEVRPGVIRLNDFDLASRLSYFVWSSCPDDELYRAASAGELQEPAAISEQFSRMIQSAKADSLFHGFFAQWLGLRNLEAVTPDTRTFPIWSDRLRQAMLKETELVCLELLRNRGTIGDFLTADFTFINPRLAELYEVDFDGKSWETWLIRGNNPGRRTLQRRFVDEERWERTSLNGQRRGILTHASLLTMTSNPTRTSPVKRGKWVLETLIGDPPPPAPPGVPALEDTQKDHQNLSLREQLEIHRANPSCASCHRVMDPIGLGLENFDAIGRWRDKDQGKDVVASGELANGRNFSGAKELAEALLVEQSKMSKHFASKLLTFALGRGLTSADQCVVDDIVRFAEARNFELLAFFEAVVQSEPFRYASFQED